MIELLYTFLLLFTFFIILFFILPYFQIVKRIMICTQSIICFIFFGKYFYKNHILWKNNDYAFVHTLKFNPIINFNLENEKIIAETLEDYHYSIIYIKDIYYKKCQENFYINSTICPITDIIIENKKKEKYSNYTELKISENKYLYFTRDNKYEKLYETNFDLNNLDFKSINFSSQVNYEKYITNDTLIYKTFKYFKGYVNYIDYICLSLLIFSFLNTFTESYDPLKFNINKILNTLAQIIILILYLFRYLKFIKIKNILFNNNYEDNYIPHKYFNLDSFALAMPITLLFINFAFLMIPKKWHILKFDNNCDNYLNQKFGVLNALCNDYEEKMLNCSFLCIPVFISTIIFITLDIKNDSKIKELYNNINYNWDTNPLQSIEISEVRNYILGKIIITEVFDDDEGNIYTDHEFDLYKWKNKYFNVKRLYNFNYINIYQQNNGKLCGKDSFGNNLYFPINEECPINDIFISNSITNKNIINYTKLDLDSNTFLYYTNKNIEGKIIIDLKINNNYGIHLNPYKSNGLCHYVNLSSLEYEDYSICNFNDDVINAEFYKIIDSSRPGEIISDYLPVKNNNHDIYLYSVYYLGVNSTSIIDRSMFKSFKSNIENYKRFSICKYVFFIILIAFFFILYGGLLAFRENCCLLLGYCFALSHLIIIIINLLMSIMCLYINIKYIINFLIKINRVIDYNEYELILNILIVFYGLIFLVINIIYWSFSFIYKREDNNIINDNVENIQNNIENHSNYIHPIDQIDNNNNIISNEVINIRKINSNSDDKRTDLNKICIICLKNPIKIIFFPCKHRCLCKECYNDFKEKSAAQNCPICRKLIFSIKEDKINKTFDIYFDK